MTALQLFEEQRKKLLEMTKKLFPEYETIVIEAPSDLLDTHAFVMMFLPGNDYIPNCDAYIHWYEACWSIFQEIFTGSGPIVYNSQLTSFAMVCNNSIGEGSIMHPVDYLYEQFLTFKNK